MWRRPHHDPVKTKRRVYVSSKSEITKEEGKPPQARLTTENPEYLEEPELLIEQTRTTRGQQYEEKVEVEQKNDLMS